MAAVVVELACIAWSQRTRVHMNILVGNACDARGAHAQMVSTGADGLVKLWGVRSAECTATFDEHEGKVRARPCPWPGCAQVFQTVLVQVRSAGHGLVRQSLVIALQGSCPWKWESTQTKIKCMKSCSQSCSTVLQDGVKLPHEMSVCQTFEWFLKRVRYLCIYGSKIEKACK